MFTALLLMLKTGIGWRDLPNEVREGEKTVHRRLKEWTNQGLWSAICEQLLAKLRAIGRLDVAEVLIDGGLVKAPHGGEKLGPTQRIESVAAVS